MFRSRRPAAREPADGDPTESPGSSSPGVDAHRMPAGIEPFQSFVDRAESPERSLVVVNRTEPDQIRAMLDDLFADQRVDVADVEVPDEAEDLVVLVEEGRWVAASPLSDLERTILLVNSDIYVSGSQGLDGLEVPEVITHLDEVPFELAGYPESLKEKFLLITVSRHIEHAAWTADGGTLRSSFQRLSRIDDETGTCDVYERLGASEGLDVHVYGVPDWIPDREFGVVAHGGYAPAFRRVWFVVFVPDDPEADHAALVAVERGPRDWRGFWTYRPDLVREINRHVEREM